MKMNFAAALGAALLLFGCANPVEVVTPLPAAQRGQVEVTQVAVTLSESAAERMQAFDEKAATTRESEGLEPYVAGSPKPDEEYYETLPFSVMFPYVVQDVLEANGVTGPEKVRLEVEVDTLKTANAAMMMLLGDTDQLAGLVEVYQVGSEAKIAEFYVDTTNNSGGLAGIALRGSGVREKLSAEFAGHIAKQLKVDD